MHALVVDDDPIYRSLISFVFKELTEIDRFSAASSVAEALEIAAKEKPDFCALDWMLADGEGIELGRRILALQPHTKLTLLTAFPSRELPRELVAAGFSGYVDKTASVERVKEAFQEVIRGGMFFASTVAPWNQPVTPSFEPDRISNVPRDRLTPRELEIVALVANGQMSKEIAFRLGLSARTVDKHRANILRKVGVNDVASLTRWCMRVGILSE